MLVNRSFYRVFVINLLFCAFAHAQEQPSTKVSPRVPSAGKTGIRPPFTPVYPPDIQPAFRNLPYANKSSSQVLDLFIPAGSGPFPLVINIHGGGFMMGSKEMLDGQLRSCCESPAEIRSCCRKPQLSFEWRSALSGRRTGREGCCPLLARKCTALRD